MRSSDMKGSYRKWAVARPAAHDVAEVLNVGAFSSEALRHGLRLRHGINATDDLREPFEPAQSLPAAFGAQADLVDHRKRSVVATHRALVLCLHATG